MVRIELTGGLDNGAKAHPLEVVLPATDPRLQNVQIGSFVHLVPEKLRLFPRGQDIQ